MSIILGLTAVTCQFLINARIYPQGITQNRDIIATVFYLIISNH